MFTKFYVKFYVCEAHGLNMGGQHKLCDCTGTPWVCNHCGLGLTETPFLGGACCEHVCAECWASGTIKIQSNLTRWFV